MTWPKTKTFSTMMGKPDGSDTQSTSVVTSETKCPEASVHLHQWMDVASETKCPEASIDPKSSATMQHSRRSNVTNRGTGRPAGDYLPFTVQYG